jgi:hypothetical protein
MTHGMTAKTPVMPGEDQEVYDRFVQSWIDAFQAGDVIGDALTAEAASDLWIGKRVQRVHTQKVASRVRNFPDKYEHKQIGAADVLGRRLLDATVRGGDANNPRDLVRQLEGTLYGCEWLLDGWADLRAALERENGWNWSFKVHALHLLSRRLSASNYEAVLVYEASSEPEMKIDSHRLLNAHFLVPIPDDEAGACQAFLSIVEKSESRLKRLLKRHEKRHDADHAARYDLLAFDSSDEGERLRKYELASGRTFSRSLKDAIQYRRTGELPATSRSGISGNAPYQDDGYRRPAETGAAHSTEVRPRFPPGCENIIAMTEVAGKFTAAAGAQSGPVDIFTTDSTELAARLHPLLGEEAEPTPTITTDHPMPVASGSEGKAKIASEPPAEPRSDPHPTLARRDVPPLGLFGLMLAVILMTAGSVRTVATSTRPAGSVESTLIGRVAESRVPPAPQLMYTNPTRERGLQHESAANAPPASRMGHPDPARERGVQQASDDRAEGPSLARRVGVLVGLVPHPL